jgi:hypothetical protein
MSCGYIYIASNHVGGEQKINYLQEAVNSARSLRKVDTQAHITLYTNQKINDFTKIFNKIEIVEMSLRCKQEILSLSPYDKTIYIDTDTYINHSIVDLFEMLDNYEILGVHDYARKRIFDMEEYMRIPYAFSEINGGIIAFRKCERWKLLIELWNKYYQKYIKITIWDQPSFRIALWESQIKLYCLPVEYNRRGLHTKEKCINLRIKGDSRFGTDHLKTRIYHYHGLEKLNSKGKEKMSQFF